MPYGKKKPMMMKMGSKEKNTPMNFSEKAMKYMKDMPALYGKPKMDGDPVRKTRKGLSPTVKTVDQNIDKTGYKGTARNSMDARGSKKAEREYKKKWLTATKDVKQAEKNMKFVKDNPGQRELNPEGVKKSLTKAKAKQKKFRNLMIDAHKDTKKAPKMYGKKK